MRIVTWNINSIRIRLDLIRKTLKSLKPDVLCLQETKVEDTHFPLDDVKALGFDHVYYTGQKSYNGMAILSRTPITHIHTMDILNNGEKRHIGGKLENGLWLHNFYVPAGGDIPDPGQNPKFKDKLAFVDAMQAWSDDLKKEQKTVIVGDFNIAPHEHDVWSHKQLLDVVSHTPIETEKLLKLQHSKDWQDVARVKVPLSEKLYSWWSYRNRDWAASNRGRRLDHIWTSHNLKKSLHDFTILRDARGFENPSDHVPVLVEIK